MIIGNSNSITAGLPPAGVYPFRSPVAKPPLGTATKPPQSSDSIRISAAANAGLNPTYGTPGLQAASPAKALEAIGKIVAARVSPAMDFSVNGGVSRAGAMPFYTNPTIANGVATSTSAARLGQTLDTTG